MPLLHWLTREAALKVSQHAPYDIKARQEEPVGELDKQLVEELKRRLPTEVRKHLRQLILFGSRARGDAAEDSDLDLVALVDNNTPELERALDDTAYNVMWDHDFQPVISLKVFSEARFHHSLEQGFSFYRNVMKDGVVV